MPLQTVIMDDLTYAAEQAGRYEVINNPAGQVAGMLSRVEPAAVIVRRMADQAAEVIERLQAFVAEPVPGS